MVSKCIEVKHFCHYLKMCTILIAIFFVTAINTGNSSFFYLVCAILTKYRNNLKTIAVNNFAEEKLASEIFAVRNFVA